MLRFRAIDVGQLIQRFTKTRIAGLAHYHCLEIGRIPGLSDDVDRKLVAYLTRRNGACDALALHRETLYGLCPQFLAFDRRGAWRLRSWSELRRWRRVGITEPHGHLTSCVAVGVEYVTHAGYRVVDENLHTPGAGSRCR